MFAPAMFDCGLSPAAVRLVAICTSPASASKKETPSSSEDSDDAITAQLQQQYNRARGGCVDKYQLQDERNVPSAAEAVRAANKLDEDAK